MMTITDEILVAYADGELDNEQYRMVEDELGRDQRLQDRLDALVRANELARAAFHTKLDDEIPPHLIAAIYGAQRPDNSTATQSVKLSFSDRVANWFGTPLPAAGFAAVMLLVLGMLVDQILFYRGSESALIVEYGPVVEPSPLHAKLEHSLSGEASAVGDFQLEILATFIGDDNRICREYQATRNEPVPEHLAGIACRIDDATWEVVFTVDEHLKSGMKSDIYATASDGLHEAIDSFIERHIGVEPLSEMQEHDLLKSKWIQSN